MSDTHSDLCLGPPDRREGGAVALDRACGVGVYRPHNPALRGLAGHEQPAEVVQADLDPGVGRVVSGRQGRRRL